MKLFRLDKRLLTGMALIDEQHRQYGKFVNAFLKVCQKHDHVAEGALRKAFTFLHVYARQHLQEEAALMETYAYPGRVEHLERHHFFSAWIDQTEVQLANGSTSVEHLMKIHYMLVEWFKMHIRSEDRKLTDYLKEVAEKRQDSYLLNLIRDAFSPSPRR
jgi:hemerythrin-like metal-binding protein